jgi:hypothetical protein
VAFDHSGQRLCGLDCLLDQLAAVLKKEAAYDVFTKVEVHLHAKTFVFKARAALFLKSPSPLLFLYNRAFSACRWPGGHVACLKR